ncbi:hypothetical protein SSBR45G_56170 [Bradyrhizobium sp. SSBR45G]|uniref:hypothetical protein n=1 Tax=unclassified Bradyrhizobium TaxID=2631580 RepID=UPI002342982E|nr:MULTISPECIES: hypothetical protein [unclassified Bradyrhizobium]GLH80708.1 hypothetical protein SSBR45G_56170 [Bradyrhizobium sp. SSBR45G]GLH88097.1 hypothetical protein SSBR45R_55580 [Bradyrhizobium sp. SSBR45R]
MNVFDEQNAKPEPSLEELAREVADDLQNWLSDHPVLQIVEISTDAHEVIVIKPETSRKLRINCRGKDSFELVDRGPDYQTQVSQPYPSTSSQHPITQAEMVARVKAWLKA